MIRTRKVIDDTGAAAALDAAETAAGGARVVIAVVDPWGELVALRRTAGAQAASRMPRRPTTTTPAGPCSRPARRWTGWRTAGCASTGTGRASRSRSASATRIPPA